MHAISQILSQAPILTVFLVIGLGTAVGQIPFGPIRFGAAGALFAGLALSAIVPGLGHDLTLLRALGLGLFCYTVGIAAGNTFFRDLRRQLPLMVLCVVGLVLAGFAGAGYCHLVGVSSAYDAGAFAGALTSPVLDSAIEAAGNQDPAVGYALSYPVGVAVAIIMVALVVRRNWPSSKDPRPASADGIVATSVEVKQRIDLATLPEFQSAQFRLSYLERENQTRVINPTEELLPGDRVVVVGTPSSLSAAVEMLGSSLDYCLAHDRSRVDYRRLTVSSTAVAGRTIGELDFPGRFNGVITRVRRGDLDLLANPEMVLELGDRAARSPNRRLHRGVRYGPRRAGGADRGAAAGRNHPEAGCGRRSTGGGHGTGLGGAHRPLHLGAAARRQLNYSSVGFAAVLGGNWAGFRPGICGRSFLSHRCEGGGTGGPDCGYQWRRGVGWWASVWL